MKIINYLNENKKLVEYVENEVRMRGGRLLRTPFWWRGIPKYMVMYPQHIFCFLIIGTSARSIFERAAEFQALIDGGYRVTVISCKAQADAYFEDYDAFRLRRAEKLARARAKQMCDEQ